MQTTRENLPCSNRLLTLKPNIPQQVSSAEVGGLQMPLKIFLFPLHRAEPAASSGPGDSCNLVHLQRKRPKTHQLCCWLLEKVPVTIPLPLHVRIYFTFGADIISHLTCQIQWKIDATDFSWQHHAGILWPYQPTDVVFQTKSGPESSPSSLFNFILINPQTPFL